MSTTTATPVNLRARLERDAAAFLQKSATDPYAKQAAGDALARLIAWTERHAAVLRHEPTSAGSTLVGVRDVTDQTYVWRVYPRDGAGKVALLVSASRRFPDAVRATIIEVLGRIEPGRQIGPRQQLEVGLPRLAHDGAWTAFERALDVALTAVAPQHGAPSDTSVRLAGTQRAS